MANEIVMQPLKHDGADKSILTYTNPDKAGWLKKQSGRVRAWNERWFVLKDQCIYYFRKPPVWGQVTTLTCSGPRAPPHPHTHAPPVITCTQNQKLFIPRKQQQTWHGMLHLYWEMGRGITHGALPRSSRNQGHLKQLASTCLGLSQQAINAIHVGHAMLALPPCRDTQQHLGLDICIWASPWVCCLSFHVLPPPVHPPCPA